MNLQDFAAKARKHFVLKTRDDGSKYWTVKNRSRAPKWFQDMCFAAHNMGGSHMLPDDFRYKFIVESLNALEEHSDSDSARDSLEPDVYNSQRNAWLGSHVERSGYVDEAVLEFGHSSDGVTGDLGLGQLVEMYEVFDALVRFWDDNLRAPL